MGPATKVSHVWSSRTLGPTRVPIALFYNIWFGSVTAKLSPCSLPRASDQGTQRSWTQTDDPTHFPITCPLRYCAQHWTIGEFASTQPPAFRAMAGPFPWQTFHERGYWAQCPSTTLSKWCLRFWSVQTLLASCLSGYNPPFLASCLSILHPSGFVFLAPDTLLTNNGLIQSLIFLPHLWETS